MKENSMIQGKNQFVKKEQEMLAAKMGNRPALPGEMKKFNAFMSNNGESAEAAGKKVAGSLDDAFPLK